MVLLLLRWPVSVANTYPLCLFVSLSRWSLAGGRALRRLCEALQAVYAEHMGAARVPGTIAAVASDLARPVVES